MKKMKYNFYEASRRGQVDSTFACWVGKHTAAQVSNPPLLALHCLHEGCPEDKCAVYMLMQCTPLLVEKADVAPNVTLRFTAGK